MQHVVPALKFPDVAVSILIQPEGRMQPLRRSDLPTSSTCFNPHPTRRPDATVGCRRCVPRCPCFNPHPTRRPDATGRMPSPSSIRIRLFQSSSNPKAGCNSCVGIFYLLIANLHSDAAAEGMMDNFNACFQHILSTNANLQLTGAITTGSRYASSGPVKSTTLPWPNSSTCFSRLSGNL